MESDQNSFDFEEMVRHSLELSGSINRNGFIQYVSDACKSIIGYGSSEITGRNFLDFIHPDNSLFTKEALQEVFEKTKIANFENVLIHKDGHTVPMRWHATWSEKDDILYFIGRDITEQKESQIRFEASEQRYRALFDNSPDIIFVENKEGLVTEANQRFIKTFGISDDQIINFSACSFLPPGMAALNESYLQQALLGNCINFDLELEKDGEKRIYDTVKHPIIVRDEIVGVQTIAKDITPIVRSFRTIEQQANKLNTIFESITNGFFTIDRDWNFTYINREAARLMHLTQGNYIGKSFLDLFTGKSSGKLFQQYQYALETKSTVQFEAYSERTNSWIEVKAFPSEEGLSVYFDDITERVKSRQELEKLSLVASKTTNGVVIIDNRGRIEWVNEGFTTLTGYRMEEAVGKLPTELLQKRKAEIEAFKPLVEKIVNGSPTAFEILNYKKNGEEIWFSVQVNPIHDEDGVISRYVTIQTDITERVKTQQELEKLSLVASKVNNGVVITDRDDKIEWVNNSFTRLTGYSLEDAVGKKPAELLRNHNTDIRAYEAVKERMMRGEPVSFEILNARKNGEEIWFSIQVSTILDEKGAVSKFVAIQTDITDKVKTQQELEKLSLVASKTNNSVLIADKEWRIEWVNDGFTRLLGYSMEEAVGKKPSELLKSSKTDNETFNSLEKKLLNGDPVSFEVLNLKKSGEEVWLSLEISPVFSESGELIRYIEVHTDITALKKSELELSKLAKDLYRQNNDLQQFSYIVSHNLRSPVANAIGLVDLLTKIKMNPEMLDFSLLNLKKTVLQLDTVLQDMNTILSIRDSRGNIEQEKVALNSVIQQALSSLQEPLQNCGGTVINDIDDGLVLRVNKPYLYSVFYNFLSNAIKYRSEARPLEIRIKCFGSNEKGTLISFSDNGSGFDLNKANNNVFKLYKRFHANKKGRGIGLYLVKTHLESMGGHVEVSSRVGAGTRFLIYLPKEQYENIHN